MARDGMLAWSSCLKIANALFIQYRRWTQARLGMSVTTQGGSGRQRVTGSGRNISTYRFVLLNVYRFRET